MISKNKIKSIGKFQKTHALKGELNLILEIDPLYFQEGNPMILDYDGIFVPYYVDTIRPKGSTSYLVKLDGVNSEKEASRFVNKEVFMLAKDAETWIEEDPLNDDDFLIGFKVWDSESDEEIGVISEIDNSTANIILIVEQPDGEEIFIPANEELVKEINEEGKVIKMIIPEGLLGINKKDD